MIDHLKRALRMWDQRRPLLQLALILARSTGVTWQSVATLISTGHTLDIDADTGKTIIRPPEAQSAKPQPQPPVRPRHAYTYALPFRVSYVPDVDALEELMVDLKALNGLDGLLYQRSDGWVVYATDSNEHSAFAHAILAEAQNLHLYTGDGSHFDDPDDSQ